MEAPAIRKALTIYCSVLLLCGWFSKAATAISDMSSISDAFSCLARFLFRSFSLFRRKVRVHAGLPSSEIFLLRRMAAVSLLFRRRMFRSSTLTENAMAK